MDSTYTYKQYFGSASEFLVPLKTIHYSTIPQTGADCGTGHREESLLYAAGPLGLKPLLLSLEGRNAARSPVRLLLGEYCAHTTKQGVPVDSSLTTSGHQAGPPS